MMQRADKVCKFCKAINLQDANICLPCKLNEDENSGGDFTVVVVPSLPLRNDFVCEYCYNLDKNLIPTKRSSDFALDDASIRMDFSKLEDSATRDECERCIIIYTAIVEMHKEWNLEMEGEDDNLWYLDGATDVSIAVREGHGVRVGLTNLRPQVTFDSLMFEFYTRTPSDSGHMSEFGIARDVPERLTLENCLILVSQWIKICKEQHSLCGIEHISTLPSRVLDLSFFKATQTIYLRDSATLDKFTYMTLSHCWGNLPIITTQKATLQDRMNGIHKSELSKTFKEAVAVTDGLGVQYLWIDSLCIVQDDLGDWEGEASKMADIYAGSQLNIAATHASNGKGGCFGERYTLDPMNAIDLNVETWINIRSEADTINTPYSIQVRFALHVAHDHFTQNEDYISSIKEVSPLLNRAWVFQERLISPRTLHFHAEELVWECNHSVSSVSCECSRLGQFTLEAPNSSLSLGSETQLKRIYSAMLRGSSAKSQILDNWIEIIGQYCNLELTVESDRLIALSSLASRVATRLHCDYLAGIWSLDLPRSLCWQLGIPNTTRPATSKIPSWSWASICSSKDRGSGSTLAYDHVTGQDFVIDQRFVIRGFEYTPKSTNLFADCVMARLDIEGSLISVICSSENISPSEERPFFSASLSFEGATAVYSADCTDNFQRPVDTYDGDGLYCLLLGTSTKHSEVDKHSRERWFLSLVLKKLNGEGNFYKRVGFLYIKKNWWPEALVVHLTII